MAEEQNFTPLQRAKNIANICKAQGITVSQIQTDAALCSRVGIDPAEVVALKEQLDALQKANIALTSERDAAKALADKATATPADRTLVDKALLDKEAALKAEFDKTTIGKDDRTVNAAKVQLELKRAGLLEGKIDGVFGDNTRAALGKVTAENSNPALKDALSKLDVKTYNQANQAAINAAKDKGVTKETQVSENVPQPQPRPVQVTAQAEREAKIKAAQTELAKAGFFGDAAKEKPETVVDGKIGAKTKEAMAKANDAVVKETANGKECPPALKDTAVALQTLKEIQGNDAKAQAAQVAKVQAEQKEVTRKPAAKPEPTLERHRTVSGESNPPVQKKNPPQPENSGSEGNIVRKQATGSVGPQPHINNRGENYGNQIEGMNRLSNGEIVKRLGPAYIGAPIFHIGNKLPEIRDIHRKDPRAIITAPSPEKELVPVQTAASPGHPHGQTVWIPSEWHFKLAAHLRKNIISLAPNASIVYRKDGAVLDGATNKPISGLSPETAGGFGNTRDNTSGTNGPNAVSPNNPANANTGPGVSGKDSPTGGAAGRQ